MRRRGLGWTVEIVESVVEEYEPSSSETSYPSSSSSGPFAITIAIFAS